VAVDDRGFASKTLFERELKRPAHVLDTLGLPRATTGATAPHERECRLGQAEGLGEGERRFGGSDPLGVTVRQREPPRSVGQGLDEFRPGRLLLEQLDCLVERFFASRVPEPMKHESEAREDAAAGHRLVLLAVKVEGLFERVSRLEQPALLLCGV
jgi:hypothetical protein